MKRDARHWWGCNIFGGIYFAQAGFAQVYVFVIIGDDLEIIRVTIDAQDRVVQVAAVDRSVLVEDCGRVIVVDTANRQVYVNDDGRIIMVPDVRDKL